MPIVQAGRQFTAEDLQRTAGDLASLMRDAVVRGEQLKAQLETWPDADLVTLGLEQPEINAIKGYFIGDLPNIATLVRSSPWINQLLGTGV